MPDPQPAPPTHPVVANPFIFEGSKVKLRYVTMQDCTPEYAGWLQNPEVNRFLETRHEAQDLGTVVNFVAKIMGSEGCHLLAIVEASTGRHIGNIKVGPINQHHQSADISYFIGDPTCWGKGYATEAIKGATKWAFNKLKLYNIEAGSYAKNLASIKALKKAGFHERGRMLNALCTDGEKRDDHVLLSLTLPEMKSSLV